MSVLENAVEIINRKGWVKHTWKGPNGEVCAAEAINTAWLGDFDWRRPEEFDAPEPWAKINAHACFHRAARELFPHDPIGSTSSTVVFNDSHSEQDVRRVFDRAIAIDRGTAYGSVHESA